MIVQGWGRSQWVKRGSQGSAAQPIVLGPQADWQEVPLGWRRVRVRVTKRRPERGLGRSGLDPAAEVLCARQDVG